MFGNLETQEQRIIDVMKLLSLNARLSILAKFSCFIFLGFKNRCSWTKYFRSSISNKPRQWERIYTSMTLNCSSWVQMGGFWTPWLKSFKIRIFPNAKRNSTRPKSTSDFMVVIISLYLWSPQSSRSRMKTLGLSESRWKWNLEIQLKRTPP